MMIGGEMRVCGDFGVGAGGRAAISGAMIAVLVGSALVFRFVPASRFGRGCIRRRDLGTGAGFTINHALGTRFTFENVPEYGYLQNGTLWDLDDEGLAVDLVIHNRAFTATANNTLYDVSDIENLSIVDVIRFSAGDFVDLVTSRVAFGRGRGHLYHAPEKRLYCQTIARGAVNIAAGAEPRVQVGIVAV